MLPSFSSATWRCTNFATHFSLHLLFSVNHRIPHFDDGAQGAQNQRNDPSTTATHNMQTVQGQRATKPYMLLKRTNAPWSRRRKGQQRKEPTKDGLPLSRKSTSHTHRLSPQGPSRSMLMPMATSATPALSWALAQANLRRVMREVRPPTQSRSSARVRPRTARSSATPPSTCASGRSPQIGE